MKVYTTDAMAAIMAGTAIVSGALLIACDPPVKVWGGHGNLTIGPDTYIGVGDRGMAQSTTASLGATAQAVALVLSGVDPDILPLLNAADLQGAAAVLTRLIFDSSGTQLLDYHVFTRGRIDAVPVEETPKGEASITVTIEGAARSLGRRGGRMRSDPDQLLVSSTDRGLRHVSYAGEKQLYWGGEKPATAGSALGGATGYASASAQIAGVFQARFNAG
jgi:hypothetical protein